MAAARLLTTLLVIMAVLVQPGSSQFPPPAPQPTECFSALTSVPSCVTELYMALFNGQFGVVGPACCEAITKVTDQCWSRMFPFNPMFPPMLMNFCSAPPPSSPTPQDDVVKCWAPFGGANGCVWDIYRSLFSVPRVGIADPGCCKLVRDMDATCWPKMFPANPVLLRTTCASGAPLQPNNKNL